MLRKAAKIQRHVIFKCHSFFEIQKIIVVQYNRPGWSPAIDTILYSKYRGVVPLSLSLSPSLSLSLFPPLLDTYRRPTTDKISLFDYISKDPPKTVLLFR